jgi:hypothetical protein
MLRGAGRCSRAGNGREQLDEFRNQRSKKSSDASPIGESESFSVGQGSPAARNGYETIGASALEIWSSGTSPVSAPGLSLRCR